MNATKKARKWAQSDPKFPDYQVLLRLVTALEEQTDFNVIELYALNGKSFELAIKIQEEWRLDRYLAGTNASIRQPARAATFAA